MTASGMNGADLLAAAWAPLLALAEDVNEQRGWIATHLPGWTTRDLLFHLATDAQRLLVALFTPADGGPDTDEIDYWRAWSPATAGAQAGLRGTRAIAAQWASVRGPAELFLETARAAQRAGRQADPARVVRTQGRTLTVDSLLRTVSVEAGVHHLDLEPVLPDRPAAAVLQEIRRVLEALLGRAVPSDWDDARWARLGTGRVTATRTEHLALGADVERLPLFG